jgi:hypothetical protein
MEAGVSNQRQKVTALNVDIGCWGESTDANEGGTGICDATP